MSSFTKFVARAYGDERLVKAEFVAAAAFSASAVNYWTVTLRLRRKNPAGTLQTYGGVVGAAYSLATRNLSAGVAVTLYDDERGLPMADGEELWATLASTGSPATLPDPAVVCDIQPLTR